MSIKTFFQNIHLPKMNPDKVGQTGEKLSQFGTQMFGLGMMGSMMNGGMYGFGSPMMGGSIFGAGCGSPMMGGGFGMGCGNSMMGSGMGFGNSMMGGGMYGMGGNQMYAQMGYQKGLQMGEMANAKLAEAQLSRATQTIESHEKSLKELLKKSDEINANKELSAEDKLKALTKNKESIDKINTEMTKLRTQYKIEVKPES